VVSWEAEGEAIAPTVELMAMAHNAGVWLWGSRVRKAQTVVRLQKGLVRSGPSTSTPAPLLERPRARIQHQHPN
jgi:hypothetical protein